MAAPGLTSLLLVSVTGLLFGLHTTDALQCLQCPDDGATTVVECNRIARCQTNEACFLDIKVEVDNLRFYAGCKFDGKCPNLPNNVVGRGVPRELRPRDDNTLCTQCCTKDFCNSDLCDSNLNFSGYTTCLSCVNSNAPETCDTLEFCDPAQDCYSRVVYDGTARNLSYTLGCNRKLVCGDPVTAAPPGKRSLTLCVECCNGKFCNFDKCRPKNSPSP